MYFVPIVFLFIGIVCSDDKKKKVKVDIYFEPLCPISRDVMTKTIAPQIEKLKDTGKQFLNNPKFL